jgi:hypothetical protein
MEAVPKDEDDVSGSCVKATIELKIEDLWCWKATMKQEQRAKQVRISHQQDPGSHPHWSPFHTSPKKRS